MALYEFRIIIIIVIIISVVTYSVYRLQVFK